MINFNTDLADERRDIFKKANKIDDEVPGIETEEKVINENVKIYKVKILDEQGENALGKPRGIYTTIDVKNLKIATDDDIQKASEVVTEELKNLFNKHIQSKEDILVVGLGNVYVTPDSLGPKVIQDIDVTRHLLNYAPQYLDENTRPVSAISPGVLGTTGIETVEILKGIVNNIKPKLVIVIDSLASKSIERISSTIQIADTGIVPGAGVGNVRNEISQESLGIPVVAIGVPMVVDAATIATDSLDMFIEKVKENNDGEKLYNILSELTGNDKYEMIREVLSPNNYNLIVTPKEIDDLIENMSSVIARGINFAL